MGLHSGDVHLHIDKQEQDTSKLIERIRQDFFQRLKNDQLLKQALNYYVFPDMLLSLNSSERHSFNACLFGENDKSGFLRNKNNCPLLLLQGDSGGGKSLGLWYLTMFLWLVYDKKVKMNLPIEYVPLLIELKNLKKAPESLIFQVLKKRYHYTNEQTEILKSKYQFLFLLDGYDELPANFKGTNLYQNNDLSSWNAKVIITCRSQYLGTILDYQTAFKTSTAYESRIGSFQELWLAPFSFAQIETYLESVKTIESGNGKETKWSKQEVETMFQQHPSLRELVATPLLLKMAVDVLAEIHQKLENKPNQIITQAIIYEAFTEKWFKREVERIKNNYQSKLTDASFRQFAQKLAFQMFQNEVVEVSYSPSAESDCPYAEPDEKDKIWEEFFADKDEKIIQKRMACPLRCIDHLYSFYHKSFLEYFTARYLFYYLGLASKEEIFKKALKDIERSPINQKLLTSEPAVINFLAEMIQEDSKEVISETKKERLFQIVIASRNNEKVATAAANAITILNYAKVNFSGKDLSEVHIPVTLQDANKGECRI